MLKCYEVSSGSEGALQGSKLDSRNLGGGRSCTLIITTPAQDAHNLALPGATADAPETHVSHVPLDADGNNTAKQGISMAVADFMEKIV